MAGIYLHIPFCKSRCIYCDFYSTTRSECQQHYVRALCRELSERKDYLKGEPVQTIYFGGGTPSQLGGESLSLIFATIEKYYGLNDCKEITLEANPDDLTPAYLQMLKSLPVNRISMGVQTFNDETLKLLNRRHNSNEAIRVVELCREAGFSNISIDLIYGLPGETVEQWEKDLQQAVLLHPNHISAYSLTYEENTPIFRMRKEHLIKEVDEQSSVLFYSLLMERLKEAGYEHYEISNFCLPNQYSRHNSSYWQGTPYLGCGTAAHSFNGSEREWNVADLDTYIAGMEKGERKYESEQLTAGMRYNEYVITSLRTSRGIDIKRLRSKFGDEMYRYCLRMADSYLKNGKLEQVGDYLKLSRKGIFISDGIMSDLLQVDE